MDLFMLIAYIIITFLVAYTAYKVHEDMQQRRKASSASSTQASPAAAVDMTPPAVQQSIVGPNATDSSEANSDTASKSTTATKTNAAVSSIGNMWYHVKGVKRRAAGEPCAVRTTDKARLAQCDSRKANLIARARNEEAAFRQILDARAADRLERHLREDAQQQAEEKARNKALRKQRSEERKQARLARQAAQNVATSEPSYLTPEADEMINQLISQGLIPAN